MRHIQLLTEEMANTVRDMFVRENRDFLELASTLSTCEMTRSKGGDLGWSSSNSSKLESLEEISHTYPPEIINAAISMHKGDVRIVSSVDKNALRRWHVIQLLDVQTTLTPVMQKRKVQSFLSLRDSRSACLGKLAENMHTKTYVIDTMGCQMNTADSERIEGQLVELGYEKSMDASKANVVVINTCSIRDHAEQKVYSHMGSHAKRKRKGEDVTIVIAGCVAQQEGQSIVKRFPEVDIVMGPQYANKFSYLLESVFGGNQVIATDPIYQMEDTVSSKRESDICAYVNVIYGCNERCTYCVVPNTRGVEQSRTKDAIIEEVQNLVKVTPIFIAQHQIIMISKPIMLPSFRIYPIHTLSTC